MKSKMNKDLDERIIPPGEYRDAMNINVSKSEDGNVGSVETVKGNNIIASLNYGEQVIGSCEDFANDRVYLFVTNFIDNSTDKISNQAKYGSNHRILMISNATDTSSTVTVLCQGHFLNFSITHYIQANILEDFLFFTDNRNQPRKLNIERAIGSVGYYDTEDKISVAKFAPFKAPKLHKVLENYAGYLEIIQGSFGHSGARGDELHEFNLPSAMDLNDNGTASVLSYRILTLTTGNTSEIAPGMAVIGLQGAAQYDIYITRILSSTKLLVDSKDRDEFTNNSANMGTVNSPLALKFIKPACVNVTQKFDPTPSVKILITQVEYGQFGATDFSNPGTASIPNDKALVGTNNLCVEYHLDDARESINIVSGMYLTADWMTGPAKIKLFDAPMGLQSNNDVNVFGASNFPGLKANLGRNTEITHGNLFVDPNESGGLNNSISENTNLSNNSLAQQQSREAYLHYPNPYYNNTITTDEEYLKDKIIRFAYRLKFEDNEYSIISPFTQSIFVPPSYGFMSVLNTKPYPTSVDTIHTSNAPSSNQYNFADQLLQAGLTGKLDFLENNCNQVNLRIELPMAARDLTTNLHVKEVEILFKESDSLNVKIVKTIKTSDLSSNATNFIDYTYNSEAPYKTIPDKHVTRVYDKVPIKALAQSVTGGRVVYGNYLDKYTSPANLQYRCGVSDKFTHNVAGAYSERFKIEKDNFSKISYPCSSIKQNRTYTVGVVLSDRYGRSSDVILAAPQTQNKQIYLGTEYRNGEVVVPYLEGGSSLNGFDGSSLKILFLSNIPSNVDKSNGIYGAYVPESSTFTASDSGVSSDGTGRDGVITVPEKERPRIAVGDRIRGSFGDATLSSYTPSTGDITIVKDDGTTNSAISGSVIVYHQNYNPLGWHTYKIVVLDKAEEYYNLYLPAAKAGALELSQTNISMLEKVEVLSHIPLRGDNINKLSIDYNDVSDNQKEFSTTTDKLFPRIQTASIVGDSAILNSNARQSPIDSIFTVKAVANLSDLVDNYGGTGLPAIYSTQVFEGGDIRVAQLNTTSRFGNVEYGTPQAVTTYPFVPDFGSGIFNLSPCVLEVEPAESKIEIFYETATCGLVEDLNFAINNSSSQDADGNTVSDATQDVGGTSMQSTNYLSTVIATS